MHVKPLLTLSLTMALGGAITAGGPAQAHRAAPSWDATVAAFVAASPSDEAIATADFARLVDLAVRCLPIDAVTYCLHRGWDDQGTASTALDQTRQQSQTPSEQMSGDTSLMAHLRQWAQLPRAERVDSESAELAAAKVAVGKVVYYDAVIHGRALPADFATRYPRYASWVDDRSRPRLDADAATQLGTLASPGTCSYPDGYEMCSVMNDTSKMRKQETDYYCGPASLQAIAWASPGGDVYKSQSSWASILGTTQANGTYIGTLASKINSYTTWDNYTGAYVVVSIASWAESNWTSLFRTHIKTHTAPIQLHPKLNGYNNTDYYPGYTSGHFNVGRGYSAESTFWIALYEPAGGATQGNIYTSVTAWDTVTHIRQANLDNTTQQNIAY